MYQMKHRVLELMAEVLQVPADIITEDTTMDDLEEWDSLTHVMLIGELEIQLGISISLDEAVEITNVKELLELCGI
ncbi:MAG: acyl carrier protein [Lachnospiraceae bacterium]|nr:acyl carrier protein [Lachnospiraceae bacterium]